MINFYSIQKIIIWMVFLSLPIFAGAAWQEPTCAPPGCNRPQPITREGGTIITGNLNLSQDVGLLSPNITLKNNYISLQGTNNKIFVQAGDTGSYGYGIYSIAQSVDIATSTDNTVGIWGQAAVDNSQGSSYGIIGTATGTQRIAIYGYSSDDAYGVYGQNMGDYSGYAGYFLGNTKINLRRPITGNNDTFVVKSFWEQSNQNIDVLTIQKTDTANLDKVVVSGNLEVGSAANNKELCLNGSCVTELSAPGSAIPSVMYLKSFTSDGYPANCPTDWTQADLKREVTGTSLNHVRTCYAQSQCAVMRLISYTSDSYPANCPTDWTQADLKREVFGTGTNRVRTCFSCQSNLKSDGEGCLVDEDCANGSCSDLYTDIDHDTYGAGVSTGKFCYTPSTPLPNGYSLSNTDCMDSNATVNPGQQNYFSSHRGDGSYDYNCDGSQTKKSVYHCTSSVYTANTYYKGGGNIYNLTCLDSGSSEDVCDSRSSSAPAESCGQTFYTASEYIYSEPPQSARISPWKNSTCTIETYSASTDEVECR